MNITNDMGFLCWSRSVDKYFCYSVFRSRTVLNLELLFATELSWRLFEQGMQSGVKIRIFKAFLRLGKSVKCYYNNI